AVLRNPRGAGDEEEAFDLGAARLAQASLGRGYRPRNLARARPEEAHSAAARRAAQERAGRAPVRAAGVLGAARGANVGTVREAADHTGRLGRACGAGRLRAASSSTTETSGKSARAKLSGAPASRGAIGSAGNSASAGSSGPPGNPPPRPPRPEPRFHIHLVVAVAPRRAPGHALVFRLALTRRARLEALEPVEPPIKDLHRRAAEAAASPDELEGREQSPRVVALDDGLGEKIAGHGGGVEPGTAEGAPAPKAGRKLADLRHAM